MYFRHNHVLRKTMTNKNWQKLSKLFPCKSCSGSCDIKTPTIMPSEVTEVTKIPDFFNVLTIDSNRVDVWGNDTSPLHFFHLKPGLDLRGPSTLEQC